MNKLNIFCLSLYNEDFNKIKSLKYVPVGLGVKNFHSQWLRDNTETKYFRKKINTTANILSTIGSGKIS